MNVQDVGSIQASICSVFAKNAMRKASAEMRPVGENFPVYPNLYEAQNKAVENKETERPAAGIAYLVNDKTGRTT